MKRGLLFILFFCLHLIANGQNPVKWEFNAKPKGNGIYEVSMKAKVDGPWHIYSQFTPEGGPNPTTFSFNKNPLVSFEGKVTEAGKLIKKHEEVFDVDVHYFNGDVVFTQLIKLKAKVKTNLSGTVEFMACNEEKCLPPKTVPFTLNIQ